jgi:predicted nucleotidyltransferase
VRFFTWREIRDGRTPHAEAFTQVVRRCREEVAYLPRSTGAVICGSYLMGQVQSWSDLDVVVGFEGADPTSRMQVWTRLRAMKRYATTLHVPLSLVPVDLGCARGGHHNLSIGFYNHVCWAADNGGLLGANPLPSIGVMDSPSYRRREAHAYLAQSLDKLMKHAALMGSQTARERNQGRSQAMDKPFHALRRIADARGHDCSHLGRAEIAHYAQTFLLKREAARYGVLLTYLARYREHLREVLMVPIGEHTRDQQHRHQQFLREADALNEIAIDCLRHLRAYV